MDSAEVSVLQKNDCVFTLIHKYIMFTKRIPSLGIEKIREREKLRKITLKG